MSVRKVSAREVALVVVLTAALIGFGLVFPPWGYIAVAAVWIAILIWRLAAAANGKALACPVFRKTPRAAN